MTLTIDTIPSREHLPQFLEEQGLIGVGVEIGVDTGWFSDRILKGCSVRRLYSIDPWGAPVKWQGNRATDSEYLTAVNLLKHHWPRSVIIKQEALVALSLFGDDSLDWVYIDSSHEYEATLQEMRAYWPKIRSGGLLAGHDYSAIAQSVVAAVDQFSAEVGELVHLTQCDQYVGDTPIRSWMIRKHDLVPANPPG